MAKKDKHYEPIVLEDGNGGEIVLEFNRAVVKMMERDGMPSTAIGDLLREETFTTLDRMVYYAMLMHKPDATKEEAELLTGEIGYQPVFTTDLLGLYVQTATAMQTGAKNPRWAIRK